MNPKEYIRKIAAHYPDSDSIQRILEYSSVDLLNLDIEGKPLNTWFMAIKEVVRQSKLTEFINTISAEYPDLKLTEADQAALLSFLSRDMDSFEKQPTRISSRKLIIGIAGVLMIGLAGYVVLFPSDKKSFQADMQVTAEDVPGLKHVEFVTIRYKNQPFDFLSDKSILQLKTHILVNKEYNSIISPATSQLMYQGKELANDSLVSSIVWSSDRNVKLVPSHDTITFSRHVDVFMHGIQLKDAIIIIGDQMVAIAEITDTRTILAAPKYLGENNLEIYYSDSLALIPVKIEYSTANISIPKEEFVKYSQRIIKVVR